MNIRSLTRGDGAVIGAAVLLFIASFLDFFSADCDGSSCPEMPNAWDTDILQLTLPSIFLAGLIGTGLLVGGRFLPEGRKFGAVSLPQAGVTLLLSALWASVWKMAVAPDQADMGAGAILALLSLLIGTVIAMITPVVPALAAPLLPANTGGPAPYGQQYPPQGGGYGYPGGQPGPYGQQPGQAQPPYGQHPGQPQDVQPGQPGQPGPVSPSAARRVPQRAPRTRTSSRSGSPSRWRARSSRRTARRSRSPNWRRAPGTSRWSSAARP